MSKRTIAVVMCVVAFVVPHCVGSVLAGPDAPASSEAQPFSYDVLGSSWLPSSITYLPLGMRSRLSGERYTMDGRITYENGLPAQGFRVARQPGGTWATTNMAGYFVFQPAPTGTYTVSPITPDHIYLPAERSVTVPPYAVNVDFTARADAHVLVEVGSEGVGCPQQTKCWADVERVVYWFASRPEGCMPMGIGDPDPYSIMWSGGQGNVQIDESVQPGDIIEVYGSCVYDLKAHLMMIVSPSRPYFIDIP